MNPDAAVIQDFKARVDAYMKLRKEAVKDAPRLKETNDPAKIKAAQDAMSDADSRCARECEARRHLHAGNQPPKFRRAAEPRAEGR